MVVRRVAWALGLIWLAYAAMAFAAGPALALATLEGGPEVMLSGTVAAFGSGLLLLLFGDRRVTLRSVSEAATTVICGWITVPAFAAIPFLAAGWRAEPADAVFAALAALTTTGPFAAVAPDLPAERIWMAICAWGGGFGVLASATLLTIQIDRDAGSAAAPVFATPDARLGEREASRILAGVLVAYGGVSFVSLFLGASAGHRGVELATFMLSSPATAGFGPSPSNAVQALAGGVAYGLGAVNIWVVWRLARGQPQFLMRDAETAGIVAAAAILTIAGALAAGAGTARAWSFGLYEAFSLLSTAGPPADGRSDYLISLPAAMTAAILGGSTLSTAGGLKWARVLRLARATAGALDTLANPRSVHLAPRVRSSNQRALLLAQVALATGVITGAALLSGPGVDTAAQGLALAVGGFANFGGLLDAADVHGEALGGPAQAALAIAMIAGRLEAAAILPLVGVTFGAVARRST